jgi:hypothetical protein
MALRKLRSSLLAGALLLAGTSIGVVGTASTAAATTGDRGGCPRAPHHVHTSDPARYHGWTCWIDDGDKIRVCDSDGSDGVFVHASLSADIGAWLELVATNDGDDPRCDDVHAGDLSGLQRLRLRICAERQGGARFDCKQIIWYEHD